MNYFLSLTTSGLVLGVIYALMALGLTLIFSILGVINFAHGEFYMLGGYASYYILTAFTGLHPLWAVPIAGLLVALLGLVFERIFLRPMHLDQIERLPTHKVLILATCYSGTGKSACAFKSRNSMSSVSTLVT